jgi:hypothetical protein
MGFQLLGIFLNSKPLSRAEALVNLEVMAGRPVLHLRMPREQDGFANGDVSAATLRKVSWDRDLLQNARWRTPQKITSCNSGNSNKIVIVIIVLISRIMVTIYNYNIL